MAPRWLETCSVAAIALAVAACGTDAVGVQACRQVQEAQCRAAPACGVTLEPPYHTNGSAVDECIRFYDIACLHGLANNTDPGPIAVDACVAAIRGAAATGGGDCSVVVNPSTTPACAWMATSSSASDASAAASAIDSGTGDEGEVQ